MRRYGCFKVITKCKYCQVDVYIPDPVCLRLHPVKTAREWYLTFEGETHTEIQKEVREEGLEAENGALKGWKGKVILSGTAKKWVRRGVKISSAIVFFLVLTAVTMNFYRFSEEEIGSAITVILGIIIGIVFGALTLYSTLHLEIAFRFIGAGILAGAG